jgi:predicted metal-binding protein
MTQTNNAATEVLVCTTCRAAGLPEDEKRAGLKLFEALSVSDLPEGVAVRAVECLSNCDHGCTIALRGGNRWSYVYGNLDADVLLTAAVEGISRYHATSDGLVPWRERPVHFRKNCIARIPPLEASNV